MNGGEQSLGGSPAELAQVHVHRGQRRPAGRRHDLPVVETDQRDVIRHPPARFAQRVRDAPCDLVVSAEDRVRVRRRAQQGVRRLPAPFLAPFAVKHLAAGQRQSRLGEHYGDIWGGNMLWDGDNCLALIDWKTAGAGSPGVGLGELRLQMALQYGPEAPQHVLAGWEYQSGRQATDTPYWDIVAALNRL
jgi:hypothetical protein